MRQFQNPSSKGSVVILALLATVAFSVVYLSICTSYLDLQKNQNRQVLLNSLGQVQANIINALNSDAAWDKTKSYNADPGTSFAAFAILDASGGIIYDPRDATSGFTNGGSSCHRTAAAPWNCPLRLDLQWKRTTLCNGVAQPSYQLRGSYTYQTAPGAEAMIINWQTYAAPFSSYCRLAATSNLSCTGTPPATACTAPDSWYCTSTGWGCGQIYN